ncbi:hypothetical protein BC939DRAFT_527606 [Gamsiella multidivaricata]|uniref:uncharacterized protein n=1 Tax=Gamsiella multidivaricata TaxID=101098 RepID=UPI00221FCB64|nr:uncharacterized protein BC939DRAFT_527606 [Gamsiella multidivaricata]KAG0353198.1 hypothetical protein BGZ54_002359 [Gamsiella multidivaricata]KAI7826552.1 hypothetical protein BC939DRAFT_527606 [Gamsiella multidivaricata]
MNVNAASFTPQGAGGDKPSGNASGFRSSLSNSLANEGKKSNQRAPLPVNHSKAFSVEQQQRSLPGRGKTQRQSSSKRSGHDREQGRAATGGARSLSSSTSTLTSTADSLAVSMGQLSTNDKAGRGNNKKNQVSLNHLLNFSFPIREEPQNTGPVRRRRNVNYQPFNKDKFINANFRFLMNPRRDYEVFTMDADVRVEWDDIEQVLISVPQSCPICLQTPVAGRITKCGHVYCFSCILHYLALSESSKAWRKCPICWDAIYEKDLKSVRTVQEEHDIYDQGEKEIAKQIAAKQEVFLEMKLIQRALNSTVALPRSKTFPLDESALPGELKGQPPLEFYPDAMLFSRMMITTLDRIVSELDRDIQAIEFSMEDAKSYDINSHSEEIVFFEMALSKIQERKDKTRDDAKFFPKAALERERILRQHFDRASTEEPTEADGEEATAPTRTITYAESGPEAYEMGRSDEPLSSAQEERFDDETQAESRVELNSNAAPPAESTPVTAQTRNRASHQITTMYYFYQAANGHHLYLQPLDIRILKQYFDSYEKFPDTITVKVLGIEETSLTEEVRKKCKYLGHLPLGCEVSFLDVALEGIVGEEGVRPFETEVRMRRSKRLEKEAREERERIAREHKLNPPKPRRDDFFTNDPFFQAPAGTTHRTTASGVGADAESDADLQEALRLSAQAERDDMPTLSEAHARSARRPSISQSASSSRNIPGSGDAERPAAGAHENWASSYESNASTGHTGTSTVWGTPSVPARHYDEYDDYYDEDHDYEPEVVVKRGKKKVAVLLSNNSRRNR